MRLLTLCITLPERQDRRDEFTKHWDKTRLGELLDLEFIPGVVIDKRIQGPQRIAFCDLACAASHRRAIAIAAAADAEGVLVLEDDAIPRNMSDLPGFLTQTLAKHPHPWDTVNLGGCYANWRPATPLLRFHPHAGGQLFTVRGMVTTHAILYHRRVFDDVLASVASEEELASGFMPQTSRPYDQWLASHGTMLTGHQPYFVQSGSTSDILGVPHGTNIEDLIESTYARLRSSVESSSLA